MGHVDPPRPVRHGSCKVAVGGKPHPPAYSVESCPFLYLYFLAISCLVLLFIGVCSVIGGLLSSEWFSFGYDMSYEKNQEALQKLWNEVMSDESDFSPIVSEYEPETDESDLSDDQVTPKKRQKVFCDTISKSKEGTRVLQFSNSDENPPSTSRFQSFSSDVSDRQPLVDENTANNLDHIDNIIEAVIAESAHDLSESDAEVSGTNGMYGEIIWREVSGENLRNINFSEQNAGIETSVYENYDKTPYDFYKIIINDEIFQLFVEETNKYAAQEKNKNVFRRARIQNWKNTDQDEIEKFIGCLMWMGIVSFPSISSYWSTSFLYSNNFRTVFSRNRFQMLLKTWHFSDNEAAHQKDDRLCKITPLLDKLRKSFQAPIVPGEYICIDETLVPFKGKLKFKQYISNKRHKFGIKLFKLCLEGGYLYDLKVYCGQESQSNSATETVPTKVVLNLTQDLLGKGRTLCVDNYYTSVELAHKLLDEDTYLLGTLRSNRKNNPKNVIQKKLKRGEVIAQESNTGIYVEKWKDKRDVMMLTTKVVPEMVTIRKRAGEIEKPKTVIEYNKHKSYIDISGKQIINSEFFSFDNYYFYFRPNEIV